MKVDKTNVMGFTVLSDSLERVDWSKPKLVVNTINQYSYCIAQEDEAFKTALQTSDILLPDGVGMVWATRWLERKKIKKIAGADLHRFLLGYLQSTGGRCFYMGSSPQVLDKIKQRIAKEYPNVKVGTYSPPFKKAFDSADTIQMTDTINAFAPDVVFVGMTAPKQEKWVQANARGIEKGIICSIGAVFDFYAGTMKRPGRVWQHLGLEWLGRFVKEPKRMWKRYFYYGGVFAYHLLNQDKSKSVQTS